MLAGRIRSKVTFDATGLIADNSGSTDLLTLADIKTYLQITAATEDAYLTGLIAVISTGLEAYLDRAIIKRRVVEVFPDNAGPLNLTHYPILNVVSVVDGDGNTIPPLDLDIMPDQGAILNANTNRNDLFSGRYVVTYDAGWSYSNIPATIKHGALEWAKALRYERSRDPNIARELVEDVGETEYLLGTSSSDQSQMIATGQHSGAVPPTTAMLVNSFKRRMA